MEDGLNEQQRRDEHYANEVADSQEWIVLWCGHLCKGGPYRTKVQAEAMRDEFERTKFYGSYTVESRDVPQ